MNDPLPGTGALAALTVFVTDVDAEMIFHRDVLGLASSSPTRTPRC